MHSAEDQRAGSDQFDRLRLDRFRTKPLPRQREQQSGKREGAESGKLQQEIGNMRARLPYQIQRLGRAADGIP